MTSELIQCRITDRRATRRSEQMPLKSINEIATIVGADRATIIRRAEQLSIPVEDGPKNAKLIDTRKILQIVPPPTKMATEDEEATYEQARIRETQAKAKKTEIEIEKLLGRFVDVEELLEAQNALFDIIGTGIKKSELSDEKKEDFLELLTTHIRQWAGLE